jgi:hypothetical protein
VLLKRIPYFEGLVELYCDNSYLLKSIPNMKRLKVLECSICPILINIPDNEYFYIKIIKCQWLERNEEYKENIEKLICLQRIFRRHILIRRILKVSRQIIPICWDKGRIYV